MRLGMASARGCHRFWGSSSARPPSNSGGRGRPEISHRHPRAGRASRAWKSAHRVAPSSRCRSGRRGLLKWIQVYVPYRLHLSIVLEYFRAGRSSMAYQARELDVLTPALSYTRPFGRIPSIFELLPTPLAGASARTTKDLTKCSGALLYCI